jgi:hypothetical protein
VQPFTGVLLLQQDGTEGGTTLLADSKIRGVACMCPCKMREGLAADTRCIVLVPIISRVKSSTCTMTVAFAAILIRNSFP